MRKKKSLKRYKEIEDMMPDLIEKHFPKGECKERGHAIVLLAEFYIAIADWMESSKTRKEKPNGKDKDSHNRSR